MDKLTVNGYTVLNCGAGYDIYNRDNKYITTLYDWEDVQEYTAELEHQEEQEHNRRE
jgi:hypothetical protein